MNNTTRMLAGLGACAALAFPSAAVAHSSHSHGHAAHGPNGHAQAHGQKQHGHRGDRNAIVTGTVASVDGTVVSVDVNGGNHAGRAFKGQTVQFDVSAARIRVADTNGDGKRDAADVAQGDAVLVQAWVPRDGSGVQPFAARRLLDMGAPAPDDSSTETDATPAG